MFLLVPAYPGSPGHKAVKRLCVCVAFLIYSSWAWVSPKGSRLLPDALHKSKIYRYSSLQCTLSYRYGNSHAIRDHSMLPATQQR